MSLTSEKFQEEKYSITTGKGEEKKGNPQTMLLQEYIMGTAKYTSATLAHNLYILQQDLQQG